MSRKIINWPGQRFGNLVVLKISKTIRPGYARKTKDIVWKCRCDCGSAVYATSAVLNYGNTKSCRSKSHNKPIESRFWYFVNKTATCWMWTGSINNKGYGKISSTSNGKRALISAHRLSYEMLVGPIPKGLFVCHSCDNPPCVNPDHLWLGTQKENLEDMTRKGRRYPQKNYMDKNA